MRWYEDRGRLRAEVERRRADAPSAAEAGRWVRIRCDYDAGPLCSRDGAPGEPEEVPVSLDLMVRLHRWTDLFREVEDPGHAGSRWTPEQDRAWSDEGLAIAIEMKRELPAWTVVYHDGWRVADEGAGPVKDPGAFFEYEITDRVVRSGRRPHGGAGLLVV